MNNKAPTPQGDEVNIGYIIAGLRAGFCLIPHADIADRLESQAQKLKTAEDRVGELEKENKKARVSRRKLKEGFDEKMSGFAGKNHELIKENQKLSGEVEKALEMMQCARLPIKLAHARSGHNALHYIDKAIEALNPQPENEETEGGDE